MQRTALISGAGIAGCTLAHWLSRVGFQPTLVERAPSPRAGGQAVDIRGVAQQVMHAMGLLQGALDVRTHMKGMSTLDANGHEIARTEERTQSGGRFGSGDIELFRDDLCTLLRSKAAAGTEYLYGDSIQRIDQDDAGVTVSFGRTPQRRFDLVIGADGVRSTVRDLVFGDEAQYLLPLGVGLAFFSVPNHLNLKDWQLSFRDQTSGYVVYPNLDNSQLRVGLGFAAVPGDDARMSPEAQKRLVAERSAHLGGEIPTLLKAMHATSDFYYGVLAQVRMPQWSRGRVTLVGDAGYCPTPFTGQGTSLALVGAYVLSHALSQRPDAYAEAWQHYEQRMRPFVELNQGLLDPTRAGPIPDEQMDRAKNGIELAELPATSPQIQ